MTSTTRIVAVLVHFSHRYFVWILGFSYIVAALLPEFGLRIRNVSVSRVDVVTSNLVFSLPAFLLALLLFNAGLGVRTAELKRLLDRPSVLAGAVFGNLAVPLAFIIAISFPMKYWHNPDEVQQILVGLALVVSMPIAGASTAWAQNAHGNLALSLSLVLATTTLSPLLTPLLLHAVGFITTGDYAEDLHELAADGTVGFLGAWVIVPSLLGILSNLALGERRIAAVMPYVKLVNYGVLVLLNYSNASLSLPRAASEPDMDFLAVTLVIVFALCILGFATGYLLARVLSADRSGTASLMFGLGMNNNGTGLFLASLALADHPQVMLPIIFYNLVQHLVASSVDAVIFRRLAAVP